MMPTVDFKRKLPRLVESIEESKSISEGNRGVILEFLRDLRANDYSRARIWKLLWYIKKVAEKADFDFREAEEEEIKDVMAWVNSRDLADSTKHDYRIILKRFYRWLNGGEYPECVRWIKTTGKRSNRKLPKDILDEEDVRSLLEVASSPRDRAFIAMLWETGARIGELIDLRIGDLEHYEHGMKIVVKGKTGARRLPLISSFPHIRAWLNGHPRGGDKGAPLWVNVGTRNTGAKAEYRTLLKALEQTAERAGIEKPVNPHHFRHSRATYLASRFTEAQMCEWFGWVQGSKQPAQYVHLSGRDIDSTYAGLHGIKEERPKESELAPIQCPRCEIQNDPNAKFCYQCGQALTPEAFEEAERKRSEADDLMSKLLEDKEVQKVLKRKIVELGLS